MADHRGYAIRLCVADSDEKAYQTNREEGNGQLAYSSIPSQH
ncbi:MAG: hypothetical protein OEU26_10550 [Candidatus Tectomicrobia bacterium]|nr:hypothetical protein [Candidatus Tectomicrobia bacterium]